MINPRFYAAPVFAVITGCAFIFQQMMVHKVEKTVPSAEEEEKETGGGTDEDGEEEAKEKDEGRDEEGDEEQKQETVPGGADRKDPVGARAKKTKQTGVLNLNNEVVKMRKEVKRVRALIIRKLTRQIGALKKKKGNDAEMERNQRRAERLLEEIHAMKSLVPDQVGLLSSANHFCSGFKAIYAESAHFHMVLFPSFTGD